jgi:phage shock protein PspC (stress-responsive transcriptional regulator)
MASKQLVRPKENRQIAGVAAGLANYFGVDTTLVRLIFVASLLTSFPGVLAYIILWVIMPEEDFVATPSNFDPDEIIVEKGG